MDISGNLEAVRKTYTGKEKRITTKLTLICKANAEIRWLRFGMGFMN